MVLVLAVLYTYFKHRQQQKQQEEEGGGEDHSTENDTVWSDRFVREAERGSQWFSDHLPAAAEPCRDRSMQRTRSTSSQTATQEGRPLPRWPSTQTSRTTSPAEESEMLSRWPSRVERPMDAIDLEQDSVRQEWVHAVFGPDFCMAPDHVPSSGQGLAQIPSYQTGRATFTTKSLDKLGLTLSRLALGLVVGQVEKGSEAACAGVLPGSVLVDINGMPMLAEPTKQALERIWLYEGHFEDSSAAVEKTSPEEDGTGSLVVREPVALRFIRHGRMYTVLLLSHPPWGISWGPCGNFCLIRRVYGAAANAGIPRGALLVAAAGATLRQVDHAGTAHALKTWMEEDMGDLELAWAYPPPLARASNFERMRAEGKVDPSKKKNSTMTSWKTDDGVHVKVHHPLQYPAIVESLFQAAYPSEMSQSSGTMQDWSERVSSGLVKAPSRWPRNARPTAKPPTPWRRLNGSTAGHCYGPCPTLEREQLFSLWDPLEALVYCMRMQKNSYDETYAVRGASGSSSTERNLEALRELTSGPKGATMSGAYLLQFLSLICSPDHHHADDREEKKLDKDLLPGTSRKAANELTSMLLKVSRLDEGFCQRLYFLLRSYISTFEARRQPSSGEKKENSRNLMALLHCLELLRFAEKELAGRPPPRPVSPPPDLHPSLDESMDSSYVTASISSIEPSPVSSPAKNVPLTPERKSRGFLGGLLRKKKGKKRVSEAVESAPIHPHSPPRPQSPRAASPVVFSSPKPQEEEEDQQATTNLLVQSPSAMYENMSDFLSDLDRICGNIERSLQKSFRQKIADWAMQPWSASKDTALAQVTSVMRTSLKQVHESFDDGMLLVNPVDSSELLSSVDYGECYILPSAHFPLLMTFNVSEKRCTDSPVEGGERIYRTRVEILALAGTDDTESEEKLSYVVHGAVAGTILESSASTGSANEHWWEHENELDFETRSTWGAPQTLSLRVSSQSESTDLRGKPLHVHEMGYCWIDLSQQWESYDESGQSVTKLCTADVWALDATSESSFDEQGIMSEDENQPIIKARLEVKVTTDVIPVDSISRCRKRMLLYKHDDDLRQEAFTVQCIRRCDDMLKASGLDMKILTFQCIPVGIKRGFVEWVPGSVPMSEICQPFAGSLLGDTTKRNGNSEDGSETPSMIAKAGLTKYESLRRLGSLQSDSLRRMRSGLGPSKKPVNNPVQDYLRSVAFDHDAPFLIRRTVMDTYIKSCAGYSVISYILGVGDRHLDNLLLHQSGCFFHCDFSFILGSDPKTYMPMRITEDMIRGMGGQGSDNYAKFLSLVAAAFLALRRPENVRVLLSMVRLMEASCLPDLSENQAVEKALFGLRDRLKLDLTEDQAVSYMEEMVEASLSNKMWIAVDAIHSLGKKF